MAEFQPPPTHSEVVVQQNDRWVFNPIWLQWFVDLIAVVNASGGGGGGAISHESLSDLLGGGILDHVHLTGSQATDLTDSGDCIIHYHSTDRDLANATGTLAVGKGGTGTTTATGSAGSMVLSDAPTITSLSLTNSLSSSYVWNDWNPSDLVGTLTNASSSGTAAGSTVYYTSASNSSGTLTLTFAKTGRYLVNVTMSCANTGTYTDETLRVVLGGTATLATNATTKTLKSTSGGDIVMSFQLRVTATATQTITILPKGAVTAGAGSTTDRVFSADMTALYTGN